MYVLHNCFTSSPSERKGKNNVIIYKQIEKWFFIYATYNVGGSFGGFFYEKILNSCLDIVINFKIIGYWKRLTQMNHKDSELYDRLYKDSSVLRGQSSTETNEPVPVAGHCMYYLITYHLPHIQWYTPCHPVRHHKAQEKVWDTVFNLPRSLDMWRSLHEEINWDCPHIYPCPTVVLQRCN